MAVRDSNLPFVSVVVPTYNRAPLLPGCLDSLRAQEYPPDRFEIVVVDDGSTDGTSQVVSEMARPEGGRVPSIRLVRKPNGGLNTARNAGVAVARGDPICFLDDDVELPRGWLRAMVEGALRWPEAGCLGGPVRLRFEGKAPRLCGREPFGEGELDLGSLDRKGILVCGANMAVWRSALQLAGQFDESLPLYGDEHEWEERLMERGGQVVYVADAWLWHRRSAEDLKLWTQARRRFRFGMGLVTYRRVRERPIGRPHRELLAAVRLLAHAVRRRCAWGLIAAAAHLGMTWGLLRDARRR
jgi:GT2 family glycosyltransferase